MRAEKVFVNYVGTIYILNVKKGTLFFNYKLGIECLYLLFK